MFLFCSFYYKGIIEHTNYLNCCEDPKEENIYCEEIINNFNKIKEKLNSLIKVNIEPVLKSFEDWEQLSKLDKFFIIDKTKSNYLEQNFFKQFSSR